MSKVDISILVTTTISEGGLTCGTPPRTLLIKFSTSSLWKMSQKDEIYKWKTSDDNNSHHPLGPVSYKYVSM